MKLEHFGPLDGKYKELAKDIDASARHLLALLNGFGDEVQRRRDQRPLE